MARNKRQPARILGYTLSNPDEKIVNFITRINEQIGVVEESIKTGTVSDVGISRNYIEKARGLLNIQFFDLDAVQSKRVKDLRNFLKIESEVNKEISLILKAIIRFIRNFRIILNNKYTLNDGKYQDFYFPYEYKNLCQAIKEKLKLYLPRYQSELILINKLLGLLSEDSFLKTISARHSFKVSTVKEVLADGSQAYRFDESFELEELLDYKYFTDKDFASLDITTFKVVLSNHSKAFSRIIESINDMLKHIEELESDSDTFDADSNIFEMLEVCDACIIEFKTTKELIDKEYNLYEFGQGLIEYDIFGTLFK